MSATTDVMNVCNFFGFWDWITEQIRKNPNITTKELGKLCGLNSKTIQRHINKLPHIEYIGSGYSGHWKIIETNTNNTTGTGE